MLTHAVFFCACALPSRCPSHSPSRCPSLSPFHLRSTDPTPFSLTSLLPFSPSPFHPPSQSDITLVSRWQFLSRVHLENVDTRVEVQTNEQKLSGAFTRANFRVTTMTIQICRSEYTPFLLTRSSMSILQPIVLLFALCIRNSIHADNRRTLTVERFCRAAM